MTKRKIVERVLLKRKLPLSARKEIAATMFVLGKMNKEISAELGVTPGLVAQWKKDAGVQAKIRELLNEAQEVARLRLRQMIGAALDVVEDTLASNAAGPPS